MIVDHHTVERFAENLRSKGKQPATVESYCRDAQRFLEYLGKYKLAAEKVEPETLLAYQDFLRADCEERDNSVRRTVIGIRQFYRFLGESNAAFTTPFDAVPIPVRDETQPKGLEPQDVARLLEVAKGGRPDCKAARDAAMVSLLAQEGIKANELINLKWTDLLQEKDNATLRISGSRTRAIALSKESLEQLLAYKRHYLNIKHPAIVQAPEKRIFIAFKGRDAASPLAVMTRHGLKFILYELGDKAGLSRLNTEQLRHYAVGNLISRGRSPEEIMLHMGLRRIGNIAKHLTKNRAGASAAGMPIPARPGGRAGAQATKGQ